MTFIASLVIGIILCSIGHVALGTILIVCCLVEIAILANN